MRRKWPRLTQSAKTATPAYAPNDCASTYGNPGSVAQLNAVPATRSMRHTQAKNQAEKSRSSGSSMPSAMPNG